MKNQDNFECLFCQVKSRPYYEECSVSICDRCNTHYLFKNNILVYYYFSKFDEVRGTVITANFYVEEPIPNNGVGRIMFIITSSKGAKRLVESTQLPTNITPFNLLDKLKILLPFI